MNILIISPERYQNFYTSKIQIANLLKKKYKVFFLNPYLSIKEKKFSDETVSGIHIINILSVNFLSSFIDPINHYVSMIYKRVPKIDLIWSFDTNRTDIFKNLKSKTKIFHVTDNFNNKKSIKIINDNSDCILSVSSKLKKGFDKKKTFLVGHFLMKDFLNAKFNIAKKIKNRVMIVGNFHMKEFNSKLLKKLVFKNKNLTFFLVGPILNNHFKYKLKLDSKRLKDLDTILNQKNVKFFGTLHPLKLIQLYKKVNCFCILYKKRMDNSHKILEFFSTGYPIISNSKFLSFKDIYFTFIYNEHTKKNNLFRLINSKKFRDNKYLYDKRKIVRNKTYDNLINTIITFAKNKNVKLLKKIEIQEVI